MPVGIPKKGLGFAVTKAPTSLTDPTGDDPRLKKFKEVRITFPMAKSTAQMLRRVALMKRTSVQGLVSDIVSDALAKEYDPPINLQRLAWAERILRGADHISPCMGGHLTESGNRIYCSCGLNKAINLLDAIQMNNYGKKTRAKSGVELDHAVHVPAASHPAHEAQKQAQADLPANPRTAGPDRLDVSPLQPSATGTAAATGTMRHWEIEWPRLQSTLHEPATWHEFNGLLRYQPPAAFLDWPLETQLKWLNSNSPL